MTAAQTAREIAEAAQDRLERANAAMIEARAEVEGARRALIEADRAAAEERRRDERRKEDNARATAKRLAARLGVEIEQHTDLESRPWYVSHPALEGDADPHDGDHYATSWSCVLNRVRDYEQALQSTAQEPTQ